MDAAAAEGKKDKDGAKQRIIEVTCNFSRLEHIAGRVRILKHWVMDVVYVRFLPSFLRQNSYEILTPPALCPKRRPQQ